MSEIALPETTLPAMVGPPGADEWAVLERQVQMISKSSLLPKHLQGQEADCMVIALTARELRIPLMLAVNKINVIEGTPSAAAELQVALILRAGHGIGPAKDDDGKDKVTRDSATVVYRRKEWPEEQYGEFEWTRQDAVDAGLLDVWFERWCDGDNGRKYKETWPVPRGLVEHPSDLSRSALETCADMPEWVKKQGPHKAKWKDNWWSYPKAMLWARCVSQVGRMQFADVLMGVSLTPEELGAEIDPLTGEVLSAPADDAVIAALLARAQSLPDHLKSQLKLWFREYAVPAIPRLPVKWVEAVDERIASFEQWVVDGEEVGDSIPDDGKAPPNPAPAPPTVIDTTSTPVAPPESPSDDPDPQPPTEDPGGAGEPESGGAEPDPAEPPGDAEQETLLPPEKSPLEMTREELIGLGKSRLVDAVKAVGGEIKGRQSLEQLADLYLQQKPL